MQILRTMLLISSLILFLLGSSSAQAMTSSSPSKLRTFLMGCAYGTAGGAILGAASLAFSNDPGSNVANIAKGASLGLYGGMIYGYINANSEQIVPPTEAVGFSVSPQFARGEVSGTQLNLVTAF